ncbi:MAG: hypothetical protein J6A15_05750 [Clostridia bacterium]|nr:hypothetical protein [Clostridia bacterium]
MSISKISRSIVVAIFAVFVLFLGITDFVYIGNNVSTIEGPSGMVKFGYFMLVIVLVSLYTYVREKLSRLKLQKKLATAYRYTYILLVMLATTFFKIYSSMELYPTITLILYFVLAFLMGFYTQRIIFNVSKSDVLSVLGMFIAFTLPNVIDDKTMNLNSKFIAVILLMSIYIMQTLIDELKQLNIKNKKYIKQAILLGACIGISTLCGISYLLWIAVAIALLFITSNLDSTSLNLSSRPNNTIKRKRNNYFIYKIERIKISKLIISLVIISLMVLGIYYGGRIIITNLASQGNGVCQNIVNDLRIGIYSNKDISFTNIKDQAYGFVGLSTRFYIICFVYILFMEILAIALHRKYDTKSTLVKMIFVALYSVITIFKVNVLYYQPVLTMLLVIICIINTTNIYYNREERIKMIEA